MCLCWNRDENGKITSICIDSEEISRRIHDPNYMPELKALRRKIVEEWDLPRHQREKTVLTPNKESELREVYKRVFLNK